jgi:hypothetical protein
VSTIYVQAVPGTRVPLEQKSREYVTDEKAVEVEESAYYHRRIADGDLVIVAQDASAEDKSNSKTKKG